MKVIVKFIDPAGLEYYYPKPNSNGIWRISVLTPNALMIAQVLDDASDSIYFLDYLARTNGCRMELIPTQSILGTYLSTYTNKEEIINKIVLLYIITLPIILFFLSLVLYKNSVS